MSAPRAFGEIPLFMAPLMQYIAATLVYVTRCFTSAMRLPSDAVRDLAKLTVGDVGKGRRGYFIGTRAVESSPKSNDKDMQNRLWSACVR